MYKMSLKNSGDIHDKPERCMLELLANDDIDVVLYFFSQWYNYNTN